MPVHDPRSRGRCPVRAGFRLLNRPIARRFGQEPRSRSTGYVRWHRDCRPPNRCDRRHRDRSYSSPLSRAVPRSAVAHRIRPPRSRPQSNRDRQEDGTRRSPGYPAPQSPSTTNGCTGLPAGDARWHGRRTGGAESALPQFQIYRGRYSPLTQRHLTRRPVALTPCPPVCSLVISAARSRPQPASLRPTGAPPAGR